MVLQLKTFDFIKKSIDRNLKQAHLNENFVFSITENASDIPTKIKNLVKDVAEAGFLNQKSGAMFVIFKPVNVSKARDDDKIKLERLMKTTFFVSDSSGYSSESIYKIQDTGKKSKKKDDEESEEVDASPIFYITKIEIQ